MEAWTWIKDVIALLTPVVVAWFGWQVSTSEKENKKYRELREKNEALLKKESDSEKAAQIEAIAEINKKLEKLQKDIDNMDIPGLKEQVKKVIELTNINFEYSQSLSSVITTLGNAIEEVPDIPSAGIIRAAIEAHHTNEQQITSRICKFVY